jgi:hypothetical protein
VTTHPRIYIEACLFVSRTFLLSATCLFDKQAARDEVVRNPPPTLFPSRGHPGIVICDGDQSDDDGEDPAHAAASAAATAFVTRSCELIRAMIAGAGPDAGKRLPFDSLDGSAGEPLVVALLSGSPEDRAEERAARWDLAGALVAHLNEAPAEPSPDWSRHLSDEHKASLCAIRTVHCHKRRWKQQLTCLNTLRWVAQQQPHQ